MLNSQVLIIDKVLETSQTIKTFAFQVAIRGGLSCFVLALISTTSLGELGTLVCGTKAHRESDCRPVSE